MSTENERNSMAEKLVLISSLENLEKGDDFDEWPLHVTIMPWFTVPKELERSFINAMENRMYETRPLKVVGDTDEYFGPAKTVHVRTLRNIGALASLHSRTLETLTRSGGIVDSPYIQEYFRPHITYQNGHSIKENQEVELTHMQLLRGDTQGARRVEKVFSFLKDKNR